MGGRTSKNKGKAFESKVCKFLNEEFSTEEFKRTPSSGAILGRSNWDKNLGLEEHTKTVLSADIIAPSWFRCSVECKWYADKPSYHNIIKKNDATLDGWLSETIRDAINTERVPVLFFKTNQKGIYVAIPESIINEDTIRRMSHYSMYNGFIILGIENFTLIKNELATLTESDYKNMLIELNEYHKDYMEYLLNLGNK